VAEREKKMEDGRWKMEDGRRRSLNDPKNQEPVRKFV
jgi:hypothetical protein